VRAMKAGHWRTGRFAGLLIASLLLAASPVLAQEGAVEAAQSQLISLDADNTTVITVLEILADRSQLNIVTSPEVQGRTISIHLTNTPFIEALNLVVRAAGLGYERVGNSILVADLQRLATQTGLTTRVFELQYANADEVTEALAVVSKDMRSYGSGNRLIVKAPQSIIEEIDSIVRQLDAKPAQVMLEARLVEVNTTMLQELGIDWSKITKWTQVVTEGDPGPSGNDGLPNDLPYVKYDHTDDWYRQVEAFEVTLDALISDGTAKLLANSKITTMDNQPAEIFIGQTVPVVITSLQSQGVQGGAFQSVQLEKIDVGVKLNITPRISNDGFITSYVSPEVSTIVAFVGPNNDLPQTSTRRATSVVRVRDGQKFFLGGLLNEETKEAIKKVPLLGDIPVIGYLFRHYRIEKNQTDLLIEVTPTIIRDQR
jgi:type II secretory pathway component GspD/PulD (secretin)